MITEDDLEVLRTIRDELHGDGWEAKWEALTRVIESVSRIERSDAPLDASGIGPRALGGRWISQAGSDLLSGDGTLAVCVVRYSKLPTGSHIILTLEQIPRWHAIHDIEWRVVRDRHIDRDVALRACPECHAAILQPCRDVDGTAIADAYAVIADLIRDRRPSKLGQLDKLTGMLTHAARKRSGDG